MHLVDIAISLYTILLIARLETLEVANEKLSSLNNLSEKSFTLHAANLRTYTQTLGNMKKELDSVFRRIR